MTLRCGPPTPTVAPGRNFFPLRSTSLRRGETVHNIEAWQCEHDLPYEEGLSEDACYNLFEELGLNESGCQSLFKELAQVGSADKRASIAFDTTSHSVYADGLKPFARQGFNKDGDGLDIYKIVSFFSLDSGLPVSFEI